MTFITRDVGLVVKEVGDEKKIKVGIGDRKESKRLEGDEKSYEDLYVVFQGQSIRSNSCKKLRKEKRN